MRRRATAIAIVPLLGLTSCTAAPAVDMGSLPRDVQPPFADFGSAAERNAVRAALVEVFSAREDQLSRSAAGVALHSPAERSTRLHRLEVPAIADGDLAASAYLTPADVPYRSSRFVATHWEGVAVEGDHAKAYVVGHDCAARWDGTTRTDAALQYKALLTRDPAAPHDWILAAVKAASNDQG